MQVAVLSDLHLGKKDKLDQFYRHPGTEQELYELLDYLENHVDKIVLLGDIFETLRGTTYNKRKELLKVLKCYPKFAEKIENKNKYTLIYGNHDPVTKDILGAPEMFQIEDGDSDILFFHGHQLDPIVEAWWVRNFDNFGIWAGGWLERFGMNLTRELNLRSKLKALSNEPIIGPFEKAAVTFGKRMNCNIVVTGHSHRPMKAEVGDGLFLNSGTRVAGRQDLLLIDTSANQYEVYKQFNASSQYSGGPVPDTASGLSTNAEAPSIDRALS